MLNTHVRVHVNRVADPLGRWLVVRGVTPNAVTIVGTLGTVAAALWFLPRGQFFAGSLAVAFFVLFDLIDGAMARAGGTGGTPFGAILDSTCDRLADAALFCGLVWWCLGAGDAPGTGAAALSCLVTGTVVSYIKARAEGIGVLVDGGIIERAERLVLALLGTGLAGLGVPYALDVALWLLAAGSLWTMVQRLASARRNSLLLASAQELAAQELAAQELAAQTISAQTVSAQTIPAQTIPARPVSTRPVSGQPVSAQPRHSAEPADPAA